MRGERSAWFHRTATCPEYHVEVQALNSGVVHKPVRLSWRGLVLVLMLRLVLRHKRKTRENVYSPRGQTALCQHYGI